MVSHGYLQNADVCARRVLVVHGDHSVANANTHAAGPTAPSCPPSLPMKLTASIPESSGICVICVTSVIRECGSVQHDAKRCKLDLCAMTQGVVNDANRRPDDANRMSCVIAKPRVHPPA
jgi:hypothetical protein